MAIKILKRYLFTFLLSACSLAVVLMALAYFVIATPLGGRILIHYMLLQSAQSASVDVGSFSGTLQDGLTLKNVTIKNWPFLGPEAVISIQRLDAHLPVLDLRKIDIDIFNARLDLPNSDPMLFQVRLTDGIVTGDVVAKNIDVTVLLHAFLKTDLYKFVKGTVSAVKFDLKGPLLSPGIKGGFVADKITYGDKIVKQVFAKVDLTLGYLNGKFDMHGLVMLDGGEVNIDKNTFNLLPSKVIYGNDIMNPDVDLRCAIRKDIYDIDLRVSGTVRYNKISARADPYLSQEGAFLLLGLGNWAPLKSASLNLQNDAQSMGIKRKLGEGLNVGYGYEQSSDNFRGESNSLHFIQGTMSLSDGISVNLEKTISSSHEGSRYSREDPRKDNESRLYLKFQNTF